MININITKIELILYENYTLNICNNMLNKIRYKLRNDVMIKHFNTEFNKISNFTILY